jgi:hypothetical protein
MCGKIAQGGGRRDREEKKNIPFCRSILQAVPPPSKLSMRNAPSPRPVLPLTHERTSRKNEGFFFSVGGILSSKEEYEERRNAMY